MKSKVVVFILFLLALPVGCAPEKPPLVLTAKEIDDSSIIATINGREISVLEMAYRINTLPVWARTRYRTREARLEALYALAQFEILSEDALEKGLQEEPEVREATRRSLVHLYLEELTRNEIGEGGFPQEELRSIFEQEMDRFQRPSRLHIATIYRENEEELAQIVDALSRVEEAEWSLTFQRFAWLHSLERASGRNGGELGWFAADRMPEIKGLDAVWDSLNDRHQISDPVAVGEHLAIFAVLEITEPRVPSFEDVEDEVRALAFARKMSQIRERVVDEMKEEVAVLSSNDGD